MFAAIHLSLMSSTDVGRSAEQFVADHLSKSGYSVVAQNWRTRWCEIDVVATKNNRAYFVEVKYRKNSTWGDGLDAITPKKLQQMSFAAEVWVQTNRWNGNYCLVAASVSGEPPDTLEIIEL